ncbi:MAG: helix-turn-helix transcriptional regulator [Candidatus Heimdallarchaeaceae archaeon]
MLNSLSQSTECSCFIKSHDIKIDILSSENILVNETLIIQNNSTESMDNIYLWFNQSYANLIVENDLEYSFVNDTSLISINFQNSIQTNQTTTVKLSYLLDKGILSITGDPSYYYFQFTTIVTHFTKLQRIRVRIPENSFIHEEEGMESYSPETGPPSGIEYRLALIWTFTDLNPYDNQLLFLFYDEPIGGDPLIWLFIIGPVLGLSFGVIGTIWMMRRREKRAVKKLGTIFLSETQKKFLEIIVENGGRISQKELTTMTGYTKARVSRNLISLEQQQMITREKWGRNYRIFITETGVKVVK